MVCILKYPQKRYISAPTVMMHTPLLSVSAFKLFYHFSNLCTSVSTVSNATRESTVWVVQCFICALGICSFAMCTLPFPFPLLPSPFSTLLLLPSFQWTQPTAQQGLGLSTTTEVCSNQPQVSGVYFMGSVMKMILWVCVHVCGD